VPLHYGRIGLRERRVGGLVAQRLADGIETPGGEVYKQIDRTDACVPVQPRQCLSEITFRQLHLFSCGVTGCNREQHLSLSPPASMARRCDSVEQRILIPFILGDCRSEDELRPPNESSGTTAATVAKK
jgi:hypothetical protein